MLFCTLLQCWVDTAQNVIRHYTFRWCANSYRDDYLIALSTMRPVVRTPSADLSPFGPSARDNGEDQQFRSAQTIYEQLSIRPEGRTRSEPDKWMFTEKMSTGYPSDFCCSWTVGTPEVFKACLSESIRTAINKAGFSRSKINRDQLYF